MKNDKNLNRIIFLIILALMVWVILIIRIAQIQLINRGKYVEKANAQYIQEKRLTPK